MYLAGSQLLFSAPCATVAAGACGALAGVAYHCNLLGMKALKVPLDSTCVLSSTDGLSRKRGSLLMPWWPFPRIHESGGTLLLEPTA